jgi:hypothetical protein
METFTFAFDRSDFDDLMNGRSGVAAEAAALFARIGRLNRIGNHVRIIDRNTGELIHEFLPTSQSSRD